MNLVMIDKPQPAYVRTRTWRIVTLFALAIWGSDAALAQNTLPGGAQPAPVEFAHFPDRLHAVVWRNWQLVEPARIAQAVGATEANVRRLAASMGLPPVERVLPEWRRRGYITVLRRNWHLLPYEQILTLIDMEAEELAVALREDDFLYHKLGQAKPRCEPVRWQEPNEAAQRRAEEIKQLVEAHFGEGLTQPGEPAFQFVKDLSQVDPNVVPSTSDASRNRAGLRYIYSYFGSFGDPLIDPQLDPYPDGLLARLADNGINGVWLHVVLRQLAPGGPLFPEFGEGHERRLETLRDLVTRAKRQGISVYLYMNEPRAMPPEFFAQRPELAGVVEGEWQAMCTSNPQVRQWLEDSLAHVFTEVPDLGGVFTITASENFTNCASHGNQQGCPRCKARRDDEIIAEVNATIAKGVHRGNPQAKVIAWDWGWRGHGDAADFIARLPKDVWFMSVSEWSKPIERGGVKTAIGEYSISAVGPGPRATRHWALAQQAGLKTAAKVQLNNTWELSAVPYLPVMDLVAEHCRNLAQQKIDGAMLSWSLGGYPSPNLRIAQRFAEQPQASVDEVLNGLASDVYGEGARWARQAWSAFSRAFAEYPYHGGLLYLGPQQVGPANLLFERPTGYHATMVGFPYDDLRGWRGPYPTEVFIDQMEQVASGWAAGLEPLRQAVQMAPPERQPHAQSELRIAQAAQVHFASVANQARFVAARDALLEPGANAAQQENARAQLRQELNDEVQLAKKLFSLCQADSRLGFEASNHYYYRPLDLVEKVLNCEHLKTRVNQNP
jgi:hypothetical protein